MKGNKYILRYFEDIHEVARTINKSYAYAQKRISDNTALDFTATEWDMIKRHIDEYNKGRDVVTTAETNKEIAVLLRQLADKFDKLTE